MLLVLPGQKNSSVIMFIVLPSAGIAANRLLCRPVCFCFFARKKRFSEHLPGTKADKS